MIRFSPLIAVLALVSSALGEAPAGGNIVVNGDFTKFTPQDNLWDGVDGQGFLAGNRRPTYALTDSGKVGNLDMPISVAFVDMNGDKLPDLVTCDAVGVVRVYFNSGTKEEPKFTNAEVVPLYPPMVAKDERWDYSLWTWNHATPKLAVYDWSHRGVSDLIFGNYAGDIFMIQNSGSAAAPKYDEPASYAKVRFPISSKRPWGNLFAPCVVDWNKDGKPDLLIGEGSYSANAVYVLLNQSSGSEPKFTEEQRYYLCYGDGREQLVPTVADMNGDGNLDVIVGDRTGKVAVYLNPGNWKPGQELPLDHFIQFGNVQNFGGPIAPYACDFNGDGLVDLLIGKANGRIAVAINKGTPTEAKFDTPYELKGTNTASDGFRIPLGWTIDCGISRPNLYGYVSVSDEPSPSGGKVMKAAYSPSPNKIFKMDELVVDGRDQEDDFFHYWRDLWEPVSATWAGAYRSANTFLIRQLLVPLKIGATYQLSFKVKGKGIRDGECTLAYLGANENVATKFAKVGRGVKPDKDETKEEIHETEKFTSSDKWKTVEKTFSVKFKDKNIKALDTTTLAILEFKFELIQYLGDCEIADVQISPKVGGN